MIHLLNELKTHFTTPGGAVSSAWFGDGNQATFTITYFGGTDIGDVIEFDIRSGPLADMITVDGVLLLYDVKLIIKHIELFADLKRTAAIKAAEDAGLT